MLLLMAGDMSIAGASHSFAAELVEAVMVLPQEVRIRCLRIRFSTAAALASVDQV